MLLDDKVFLNFWFDTGSSSFINRYLRENRLTVEEFRGLRVGKGFAAEPGEIDQAEPASFLYQSGYLTLRPGDAEGKFVLDYPNREVLEAMSGLMMDYILGGRQHYEAIVYDLKKALDVVDMGAVVDALNLVLSSLLYDDQIAALKMGRRLLVPEEAMGEWLYRSTILTFLRTADFSIAAEVHGNAGRSDLELANGERVWVFELKVPTTGQSDEDAAKAALAQINEKNYAGRHRKPLLMGLAVSKIKRIITAWTSQDGLSPENRPKQVFPETDPEPAPRPPRPRM